MTERQIASVCKLNRYAERQKERKNIGKTKKKKERQKDRKT